MFTKMQEILADQLNISRDKITMDSRMLEDLGADSLDFVELLLTLEDEFGVSVSDDAAKNLKTVGDVVKFVESKK